MSFLHSEQPKCNKNLAPFHSGGCHTLLVFLFFFFPLFPNYEFKDSNAASFSVKCPYFLLEVALYFSQLVYWKRPENTTIGLTSVSCSYN